VPHRVVNRGIKTLWFLGAYVSGLNRKQLLYLRVVKRGIRTLWFLGAWISGLNRENYFATGDSLESGYQDSTLWRWGPDPGMPSSTRRKLIPVVTQTRGLPGPYDNPYFMIIGSRYQIWDSWHYKCCDWQSHCCALWGVNTLWLPNLGPQGHTLGRTRFQEIIPEGRLCPIWFLGKRSQQVRVYPDSQVGITLLLRANGLMTVTQKSPKWMEDTSGHSQSRDRALWL